MPRNRRALRRRPDTMGVLAWLCISYPLRVSESDEPNESWRHARPGICLCLQLAIQAAVGKAGILWLKAKSDELKHYCLS